MTKLQSALLAGLVILNIMPASAQFGTGYKLNPNTKMGPMKPAGLGFSSDVPASYSLKMYTPYVKGQGVYPSCSGWAVSYAALSTQYAISFGLTDRNHITAKAFCPYYSYNKELPVDPNCNSGKDAGAMMLTLKNEGAKKFYLPVLGCGVELSDQFTYASQYYKIQDAFGLKVWPDGVEVDANDMNATWKKFFDAPHPINLTDIKKCISNKYPVVFGAALPTSFYYVNSELWEPTAEEKSNPAAAIMENTGAHRLHAMTVIGYDDSKFGGAFEVMNSWSETWGNKGYFWVKYDDFKMFAFSALVMELFPVESSMATKTGAVWGDCTSGYGMCRFSSGQTFEGQFRDGSYNGYGVYTWPNGHAYAGQWKNGKRDGEATTYFSGGTFGQAVFANDTFVSGYNEWTYTNGNSYRGYLKNGKFDGYGEFRFANGERYAGMFANGNLNGLVKFFASDGSTFLGYYTDGRRHGKGIIVSAAGKISAGDWVYGVYQAEKTYGFADNMTMTGTQMSSDMYLSADCKWGNCLMGEGKRVTGNGQTYTGTFVDGLEDGKGEMVYSDRTYSGSWKQGSRHGVGELRFTNGVTVLAEFKNGAIDGYVLKYDNGGNMAVDLFANGVLVTNYKQITSAPPAGSKSPVPAASEAVIATVSKLK
jgi:hypothetical protein